MYNKFRYLKLIPRYSGEIVVGKLEYYNTGETLEFYYSYYEDILYLTEEKPLLINKLTKDGILQFIQDKLRNTNDVDNYTLNHVA